MSVSVTGGDPGAASVQLSGYSGSGSISQSLGGGANRSTTFDVAPGAASVSATASLGGLTATSTPCEVQIP